MSPERTPRKHCRHCREFAWLIALKILTERDSKFLGRFDLDQLETTLDSYAAEGWKIAAGISATSIWKSSKTEILMFLQRERSTTPRIETCA